MFKLMSLAVLWIILIQPSYANILLSDTFVVFDERTRSKRISITNVSDESKQYRASFINFRQSKEGEYKEITSADKTFGVNTASKFLHVSPRSFTLKPRETQTIRLFKKHADFLSAKEGEYRAHLKIIETKTLGTKNKQETENIDALSINISALMGMSLPVILKKGIVTHNTTIVASSIIIEDNIPHMKVTLKREGNGSSRGNFDVFLDEKKIGIAKNINILSPQTNRLIKIPLYKDKTFKEPISIQTIKNKKLRISYLEKVNRKRIQVSETIHSVSL